MIRYIDIARYYDDFYRSITSGHKNRRTERVDDGKFEIGTNVEATEVTDAVHRDLVGYGFVVGCDGGGTGLLLPRNAIDGNVRYPFGQPRRRIITGFVHPRRGITRDAEPCPFRSTSNWHCRVRTALVGCRKHARQRLLQRRQGRLPASRMMQYHKLSLFIVFRFIRRRSSDVVSGRLCWRFHIADAGAVVGRGRGNLAGAVSHR